MEREISKICRKAVKQIMTEASNGEGLGDVADNLNKYLGVRRFTFGMAEKSNQVGQVTGLAWTEVGGELLTVEAALTPGKGNIIRTGSLGDVMKESVEAARALGRAQPLAHASASRTRSFEKRDIHIHLPEGATPKDGPSAGAAITAPPSDLLAHQRIPVRAHVAMTGEITLRGEVTAPLAASRKNSWQQRAAAWHQDRL